MVFITAGMGGGTGTGAAPVIARAVRELGILTVGVVTKPFHFEGDKRMKSAERGIEELQNFVDTLIVIPNQNLFRVANERTTFAQAFAMADEVLHSGVRGITDLIVMPGLINRDFADIRTVMSEMGKAMMGTGEMEGEGRALRAAEAAISNPLLDDVSMKGARAVLVNVTGGPDLMLFEVDEAVNRIRAEVDPDANILFGSALLEDMEGRVRVSVVATGIDAEAVHAATSPRTCSVCIFRAAGRRSRPKRPAPRSRRGWAASRGRQPVMMDNLASAAGYVPMTAPEAVARKSRRPYSGAAAQGADAEDAARSRRRRRAASSPNRSRRLHRASRRDTAPTRSGSALVRPPKRVERRPIRWNRACEPAMPRAAPVHAQRRGRAEHAASGAAQAQPASVPSARRRPKRRANSDANRPTICSPGVAEDDRFEIPAFLRRQANSGG